MWNSENNEVNFCTKSNLKKNSKFTAGQGQNRQRQGNGGSVIGGSVGRGNTGMHGRQIGSTGKHGEHGGHWPQLPATAVTMTVR